jgi:hypothetical protein
MVVAVAVEAVWAAALALATVVASEVEVFTVAALPVAEAWKAAASTVAWLADSMVVVSMVAALRVDSTMVADSTIGMDSTTATSGTASDSATAAATTRTTIMTTTATTIHTLTTAIAMWFSGACTLRMAGAGDPFKSAVDGRSWIDVDLERSTDRLKCCQMTSARSLGR